MPSRRNLVIEAGAGTGKTSAIVAEVLKLLLTNEDLAPERIVLMTFTEKAAGEIADRIHAALAELELHFDDERVAWPIGSATPLFVVPQSQREEYRRACRKQLERISSIRSQTIHSFCQNLLRGWPIEAGLDPQFKIIEGFERSLLYSQLYDAWFDSETRLGNNGQAIAEWEILLEHVGYLFQIRDLVFSLLARRDLLASPEYDFGDLTEIMPDVIAAMGLIRRSDLSKVKDAVALGIFRYIQTNDPPLQGSLDEWLAYFAPIAGAIRDANLPKGDATLSEALRALRTDKNKGGSIHDLLLRHRSAIAIHALAQRFIAFLDAEKRKLGVVDFDDLLLRTLELLGNERVLERIRGQFDHIFVDEFQDTDRTQAKIIEKLATDRHGNWISGKLTVVGDPKQSIYGFRRADPETYRAITRRLVDTGADERFILHNYRSEPPLLDAINAVFTSVFANAASDANVFRPSYRPLLAGVAASNESDARITFLHSTSEEKSGRHLAEAASVAEWIEANRDRDGNDLRRFAILFRRTTKLDDYLDTLDRYGIDYVLPPTKAFLDRRAPVDAVAVLRAIGRPFDRGAEISAARTPFFALTDQEIAEGVLCETGGGPASGAPAPSPAWLAFKNAIASYREAAAHRTVSETLDLLIESTNIEAVYEALVEGRRARRHLEHLRALAFEYDQKIGGSIRQFVDEVERRREEPDEMEPSLADDEANAVRIMTVHAAKGLEFETVILPDLAFSVRGSSEKQALFVVEEPRSLVMTGRAQSLSAHCRFAGELRLKQVAGEREEAEMRRLFYVAVTRATRDVVFACNTSTFSRMGFLQCLVSTFEFAKDTFETMWEKEPGRVVRAMKAGNATIPVAFEKLAVRDGARAATRRLHDVALEERLANGAIVEPAIARPAALDSQLQPAEAAQARAGSRNRTAGILLHRFLERWDGIGEYAVILDRLAAETAATSQAVETVKRRIAVLRKSPAFERIQKARTVAKELPIRFIEADGSAVERRIDRLIEENGEHVVIDYKSGAPSAERLEKDREQVSRYARAIEGMTAKPCRAWLWYVDTDVDELVEG